MTSGVTHRAGGSCLRRRIVVLGGMSPS
ncbi:unnamed protein product [Tetraodon nigroviridis]|uniref:(spotted green pufferfish) hypothetical protein n=1 Tax=Tetraodon nigroviridis TaxID=99883 RepID=Q4STE5_TETNG|nr:unnamed protein product [Tetraodon nigroviridis]